MFYLLKLLLSPKTILGIAVGAAAAWFSDPERGPDRRAQAMDAIKQRSGGAGASSASSSFGTTASPEPTLWTPSEPPAQAAAG
jgi:hypothetical protein